MQTYLPPPKKILTIRHLLMCAILTVISATLCMAQTTDDFLYRADLNAPVWVDDWSDYNITAIPGWGEWPLHFINTRAFLLSEDHRKPDADLIVEGCTTLSDNIVLGIRYRWGNAKQDHADRHEFAYAHTSDPASLSGFHRKDGSDDIVELHWEMDDRQYHFIDENTWIDQDDFTDFFTSFHVLRQAPGETGFTTVATVEAVDGRCAWSEVVTVGGEYLYRIDTLLGPNDPVDYSRELAVPVVLGTPHSEQIWVNSILGDHPDPTASAADTHTVSINLGAYHDPAEPLVLFCDLKTPNPNTDENFISNEPLALVHVDGDYHEYELVYSWTETAGMERIVASFTCRFFSLDGQTYVDALNGATYTSASCNRIRSTYWYSYLGDVTSLDYVDAWVARADQVMDPGHNGIFGDTANSTAEGIWTATPEGYNSSTYASQVSSFIAAVRNSSVMQGKAMIGNGSTLEQNPVYEHLDGIVYENFVSHRGTYCQSDGVTVADDGDIFSDADWLCNMESYMNILYGADYPDLEAYAWPYILSGNTGARLYTYASFLMASWWAPDRSYYSVRNQEGIETDKRHMQVNPEQMLGLGAPVGSGPVIPDTPADTVCKVHKSLPITSSDPCQEIAGTDCSEEVDPYDLIVAEYEKAIVVININHWCTEEFWTRDYTIPAGETYHLLHIDEMSLFDGGRFWTTPVSGTIEAPPLTAMFLMKDPIASPEVAAAAAVPIFLGVPASLRIQVQGAGWNGEEIWMEVEASELIGASGHVALRDPDGDGIYQSDMLTVTAMPGTYDLTYYARGSDGLGLYDSFTLEVADIPVTKYENASTETNMQYVGTPYSSVALDYDDDGLTDMFITVQDGDPVLYRSTTLNGDYVPIMVDRTYQDFVTGSEPAEYLRGASTADVDNDGYPDLFVAGATAGELYTNVLNSETQLRGFESAIDISTHITDSWSGVWADFDRDLDLDLYVMRSQIDPANETEPTPVNLLPLPDRLLRNDLNVNGQFTDVSADAEGMTVAANGAVGASWADFDGDGDQDLFVPSLIDANGQETAKFYINQDDGTFTEEFEAWFGDANLFWVTGIEWSDLDNDADLDLATSVQGPILAAQRIFINAGSHFINGDMGAPKVASGLRILDFDLDGTNDILLLPADETESPHMLQNFSSAAYVKFLDVTSAVGLDVAGRVAGAVASDFNAGGGSVSSDGDIDLYLGRPSGGGNFFYKATQQNGVSAPANNYVAIELIACGANNASAIGTTVEAKYNGVKQIQQVDGGNGRGGQGDKILTFGLGDYSGDVELTIQWPGGGKHDVTISAAELNPDSPIPILDMTTPTVVAGSLQCQATAIPDSKLEFTVTWETATSSSWLLDTVEVIYPDQSLHTFSASNPNNELSVVPVPGGGYLHQLKITTFCDIGFYKFRARSSTENKVSNWSDQISKRNAFCPSGGTFPQG